MRITEASEYLGVSINTLKAIADTGQIKCYKTNGAHQRRGSNISPGLIVRAAGGHSMKTCNRCGKCCADGLCTPAVMAVGDMPGPCPMLSFEGEIAVCQILRIEEENFPPELRPISQTLGVERGCVND